MSEKLERKIELLESEADEYARRLSSGRDYLMQVQPEDLTVGDCLEAFGWNKNGIGLKEDFGG